MDCPIDIVDVQRRVAKQVARFAWIGAGATPPGPDQRLVDLGIDSMSVINLAMALESEFGVSLSVEMFTADVFDTVASLAAALLALGHLRVSE